MASAGTFSHVVRSAGDRAMNGEVLRVMEWDPKRTDIEPLVTREWLVTNGLGGYASGTIAGVGTRRYHGLLVAAHPAPLGRIMLFNHLGESLRFPDWSQVEVGGVEHGSGELDIRGTNLLQEFRLEMG